MDWMLRLELALGHGGDDALCSVRRSDLAQLIEHYRETGDLQDLLDEAREEGRKESGENYEAAYAEGFEAGKAEAAVAADALS